MSTLTGHNIIGHSTVAGGKTQVYSYNPMTDERLESGYSGVSDDDLQKACALGWEAFLLYRQSERAERAVFLQTIAEEIEALGDALIDRAMLETGLPQARLQGERARTCGQLRLFAEVLQVGQYLDVRVDAALPERQPLPRPDLRYCKTPLGPVAVFGASNFPLAFSVAGGDTASALAAGCPVIVKAHSAHVGTSELVGQAIQTASKRCNMPDGVFSLLYGSGDDIGQQLANASEIKAVGFTGSRGGGMALMKTAQARPEPIPVYAEMSSINPVYLLPDVLASRSQSVAKGLVDAMMMGAGQFCTSPGVIFAIKGEGLATFCQQATDYLSGQRGQTMLTAGICQSFCTGRDRLLAIDGVQLLAQGTSGEGANQCTPLLLVTDAGTFAQEPTLVDEVFGSCAIIVRCQDMAEVFALTERLEGQLTAAVHSDEVDGTDLQQLVRLLERKAGRILFNGFGTGVEVCSAMVHGGPFPATSDSRSTSVGSAAIERFLRPVCYQNVPAQLLPKSIEN
ncbi:MAG: aldehyde dehydrogenase (NADP(+)) [Ostreibacterium sp.]